MTTSSTCRHDVFVLRQGTQSFLSALQSFAQKALFAVDSFVELYIMQAMKDDRTPEQRLEAFVNAVEICKQSNWKWVGPNWIFKSPSGTLHDLSAADLTRLHQIEINKSFLVS